MRQKWLITALFLALMLACDRTESREVVEVITPFDRRPLKFLFRMFRSFVFNNFGHTSLRRKDNTFQEPFRKDEPFPCDVNGMKSSSPPKSIHKLRPGIIDILLKHFILLTVIKCYWFSRTDKPNFCLSYFYNVITSQGLNP